MTPKADVKRIYDCFNHVVQLSLDPNAFAYLGVQNFPTKLLILQRRAHALEEVPFNPELVLCEDSAQVFEDYTKPARELMQREYPKIKLETNRRISKELEEKRNLDMLLCQIRLHPRTKEHYDGCISLLEQYRTQKRPDDMDYSEWEKKRLRYEDVIKHIKSVLAQQNHIEQEKIELVKNGYRIYYKAYSKELEDEAEMRNCDLPENGIINRLVPFGSESEIAKFGAYSKLLTRKQRGYNLQTRPFADMQEDAQIAEWLENWELSCHDKNFNLKTIRLNPRQLYDTNLALQKPYTYLQWSQGAGKTISGTAQGMYRLAKNHADYVFVVSSALSIEGTWAPFLADFGIPHKVIRCRRDLRQIFPGDFVLITLGRVKNYKRQIKYIKKRVNNRLFLVYDEAQNSSALEASDEAAKLTKATFDCFTNLPYKLLMSGTSISNNVVEAYPQLYLMYNSSYNMLSMAQRLYTYNGETDEQNENPNEYYGKPYPPYM